MDQEKTHISTLHLSSWRITAPIMTLFEWCIWSIPTTSGSAPRLGLKNRLQTDITWCRDQKNHIFACATLHRDELHRFALWSKKYFKLRNPKPKITARSYSSAHTLHTGVKNLQSFLIWYKGQEKLHMLMWHSSWCWVAAFRKWPVLIFSFWKSVCAWDCTTTIGTRSTILTSGAYR